MTVPSGRQLFFETVIGFEHVVVDHARQVGRAECLRTSHVEHCRWWCRCVRCLSSISPFSLSPDPATHPVESSTDRSGLSSWYKQVLLAHGYVVLDN